MNASLFTRLTPAFVAAFAALALTSAPARADWKSQSLDSTGKFVGKTSLAIDKDGKLHLMAYHSGRYEHMYYKPEGSGLRRHPLAFSNGYGDLAFDGEGKLHAVLVAGVREKNNPVDLVHIRILGDSAKGSLIDSAGFYHWVPDMAVDRDGRLAVSCYLKEYPNHTPARDLSYSTLGSDGKWTWTNLDTSSYETSKHSSLAFDKDNRVHIAYLDVSRGKMLYKKQTASGWESGEIGNNVYGFYIQMLMDDDGKPHIAFMRYGAGDKLYLHHAYPDTGSSWKVDSLDAGDTYSDNSAIGFAKLGDGFVVAYRDAAKNLSLARIAKDNKATLEKVDNTANTGFAASLGVHDGKLFITYLDGSGFLRLATDKADFTLPIKPGKDKRLKMGGAKLLRQGSLLRLELLMPFAGRVEAEYKDAVGRSLGQALPSRDLAAGAHTVALAPVRASQGRCWLWVKRDGLTSDVLEASAAIP